MTITADPMRIHYSLFLFLFILVFSSGCSEQQETSSSQPSISVILAEIEVRDLSDEITLSSDVVAYRRIYIASRISALVEQVNAEEGDFVREGAVLAELDVRQQQSDLRRAMILLEESHDLYERTSRLYEQQLVAEAEYHTAKRLMQQRSAEAERLKLAVEFGTVLAPMDGVITARLVEAGNAVAVNERLFTLADMDLLVVRPAVSEMNLRGISEADTVRVTLDVYPDREFDGRVRRIFPGSDPLTRLFTVEVELMLKENDPPVRPGFLARTRFTMDERREVVTVPSEALYRSGEEAFVFVLSEENDRVTRRPVDPGVQRDGFVEIREGLTQGERVAAANLEALEDDTVVRVTGTLRRTGFRN